MVSRAKFTSMVKLAKAQAQPEPRPMKQTIDSAGVEAVSGV